MQASLIRSDVNLEPKAIKFRIASRNHFWTMLAPQLKAHALHTITVDSVNARKGR